MNAARAGSDAKELRLALVLYGGVSLAIYMHGITKELLKLVHASRAYDADDETNPFAEGSTERVYWDALKHLEEASDPPVRTRVVVDVIAGTSAGGINGVYLAKALAENADDRQLRDLWLDKGDIGNLVRGPGWAPASLRLPVVTVATLLRPKQNKPVLRGDVMSVWFHEALEGMDSGGRLLPGAETLMPEDHDLQLFVTVTDFYGYGRRIPIDRPREITDWRHRHVFEFRRRAAGPDQFTRTYNTGLAFACRATSSFPGAFPAVSFADFESFFRPPVDLGDFDDEFCRIYRLSGASARQTRFIDGGVLNNYPFDHAIDAVKRQHASTEVDRRLVYVEPDPRGPRRLPTDRAPGWLATFWGGISGIPSKEPILDDLDDVISLNERVRTVREIIETSFPALRDRVAGGDLLDEALRNEDAAALVTIRRKLSDQANAGAGTGYPTYVRIKIRAVVDCLGALVCNVCDYPPESNQALFVRTLFSEWAERGGLFERAAPPSDPQVAFLRSFDLPYAQRLLQFLIAAVSWLYRDVGRTGSPDRAALDAAKARLYAELAKVEALMEGSAFDDASREQVRACLDEGAITTELHQRGLDTTFFLGEHADELDGARARVEHVLDLELSDFEARVTAALLEVTAGWRPDIRRDLFVRFLGFQEWDVVLFPVQALADAGERDHVDVVRMSPLDAHLLHPPAGGPKLEGTAIQHFAAFFHREFRENDYLWGRLDGAELLLGLLLAQTDIVYGDRCADAFGAILHEETSLATVEPLRRSLEAQLAPLREVSRLTAERLAAHGHVEPDARSDLAARLDEIVGSVLTARANGSSEPPRDSDFVATVDAAIDEAAPRSARPAPRAGAG